MSEGSLLRAVAQATGEFVHTIRRLGFELIDDAPEVGSGPLVLDWDSNQPAQLGELVDADWPGRVAPLPSYDEEFDEAPGEELFGAAA